MTEFEIRAKILAAAWTAVSLFGANRAIAMLKEIANEIENRQWNK